MNFNRDLEQLHPPKEWLHIKRVTPILFLLKQALTGISGELPDLTQLHTQKTNRKLDL
jgi:hypothetical protein